jgi:mono/diheme cytochrome c family protein
MGPQKVAGLIFLAFLVAVPLKLTAQSGGTPATAGKPQTDEQLRGEAFFMKTCFLCHNPTEQTKELKIAVTDLVGLFKRQGVTEEYVRQRIQEGIPGRMPSYRYTYTPAQFDNIIAYLKIR